MKKILTILILISISLFLNSCGIILNRHPNRVSINSLPDSAKVFIGDSLLGFTPIDVDLNPSNKEYLIKLNKNGFHETSYYVVNKKDNTLFTLDLLGVYPFLISNIFGYDYKNFTPNSKFIFFEPIDSINLLKENRTYISSYLGTNIVMVEVLPFLAFPAGIISLTGCYYKDIKIIEESKKGISAFGIKAGWGFGAWGGQGKGSEGFGYNILPSYSYEDYSDYSDRSYKYIFSVGASYFQRIDVQMDHQDVLVKKFTPSFSYQYISNNLEYNLFWGYSLGYVNAVNFFQFSFGYRF